MRLRDLVLLSESRGDAVRIMNSDGILFASWADDKKLDKAPLCTRSVKVIEIDHIEASQPGHKLGKELLRMMMRSPAWRKATGAFVDLTKAKLRSIVGSGLSLPDLERFFAKNGFVKDGSGRMWLIKGDERCA